jgi:hypothetical protein
LWEEGQVRLYLDDPSSQASFCQKCSSVKCSFSWLGHLNGPFPEVVVTEGNSDECATVYDLK